VQQGERPFSSGSFFGVFSLPLSGVFKDNTLSSKFAVKAGIKTVATLIAVEASTAFITEAGLMLLTDADYIPVGVISIFPSIKVIKEGVLFR